MKLFCCRNSWTSEIGGIVINFGQNHYSKYGNETIEAMPENGIGIMDREFYSLGIIQEQKEKKTIFCLNNQAQY